MNELALFAGAGGGLLGSILLGWRSVCYVENNPYCISVLKARIKEGYLCDAPIWDDITTFDGRPWAGLVDIITAGFPCQPFSVAGKRKGADDSRNMWPDTIRVIREVRPRYALCENVPGLIGGDHGYFGRILNDLSESGYDVRWRIISAADVGAPHLRKRLWILAYSRCGSRRNVGTSSEWDNGAAEWTEHTSPTGGSSQERILAADMVNANDNGWTTSQKPRSVAQGGNSGASRQDTASESERSSIECEAVADTKSAEDGQIFKQELPTNSGTGCEWWDADPADAEDATESQMGRVAHGIPDRVGQLRALGNAQVPGVAALAWHLLSPEQTQLKFGF